MGERVLTVGETMALLDLPQPLAYGAEAILRMAGAESNVAIALRRLGVGVRWMSRLGADPLGDVIVDTLAGEGVDVSYVLRDGDAQTGLFYKDRSPLVATVRYYRAGSAASRLQPDDVPDGAFAGVELVHLTGITMALSPSARALVCDVARRARARGITVVFDPNLRLKLWRDVEEARAAVRDVLPLVDWVLCGAEEGALLFGGATPPETLREIRSAGAGDAVVRIGAGGAQLLRDGELVTVAPEQIVTVVDEVGAGDAFAAGFVFGLLCGADPAEAVRTANRLAAAALRGTRDWETLPRLDELSDELLR